MPEVSRGLNDGGRVQERTEEHSTEAEPGSTRRSPSHLGRFGLVYALAAFWLIVMVVLPSRPLADTETAAALVPQGATPDGSVPVAAGPNALDPATPAGETGSPTGATGTVPADASGVSKGGVTCGAGVRQMPGNSYAPYCTPAWSGDNGGATARGVTKDTIRVVRRGFPDTANSQAVDAVVAQAGGADFAVVRATRADLIPYFEKYYELYGRRIEWVDYDSRFGDETAETQGRGREGACLDAEVVANELNAFAVVGQEAALSKPFTECAVQRGVIVLNGASYASENFYRQRHPYAWALITDCERINYQVFEYVGKRLNGRPAKWAGDPKFQTMTRKFGNYTPVGDGQDDTCNKIYDSETKRYGIPPVSTYSYVLDVSRFPDEAARGAIQMQRDGVTTVIMACDPISMIFLTQSATSQGYRPEWFLIGIILTDVDNAARLYDQSQVNGHMFGMSQLGATSDLIGPRSEPGRQYQAFLGKPIAPGTSGQYFETTHVYNMLQAAGPILTPATLGAGAFTLPPGGAPDFPNGYWSFQDGPNGTPGAHDHTLVDDAREVYWRGDVRSPNDGKAGTYIETYGGRRFRNGEWPTEEPPVYPERG